MACDECDPVASTGTQAVMGIYMMNSDGVYELAPDTIVLGMIGVGATEQFSYAVDTVNDQFYLSLNTNAPTSQFILAYDPATGLDNDTITFAYDREVESNPPDCSILERLVNLTVQSSTYDSVYVSKTIIDREGGENVAVFLDL
jgi:hypothetical protein